MAKLKITYNAPVVLSFTLVALVVTILQSIIGDGITRHFFALPPEFRFTHPLDYFTLFSYPIGHANWAHFAGNFTFILLLGPMLEEKYKSSALLFAMLATAVVTAVLHILFFNAYLLGASGIVFLFIILSSLVNFQKNEIPLSFLLIAILFLGREVFQSFENNNVSEFAHITGGIVGAVIGFLLNKKK